MRQDIFVKIREGPHNVHLLPQDPQKRGEPSHCHLQMNPIYTMCFSVLHICGNRIPQEFQPEVRKVTMRELWQSGSFL